MPLNEPPHENFLRTPLLALAARISIADEIPVSGVQELDCRSGLRLESLVNFRNRNGARIDLFTNSRSLSGTRVIFLHFLNSS